MLDAGVVAVAAHRPGHRDGAGAGGADRRAAADADVDAGVAGLPRAPLAERRGDRAVDRPDELARAALDRTGDLRCRSRAATEPGPTSPRGRPRASRGPCARRRARRAAASGPSVSSALRSDSWLRVSASWRFWVSSASTATCARCLRSTSSARLRDDWIFSFLTRDTIDESWLLILSRYWVRVIRSSKPFESSTTVTMSGRSDLYMATRRSASLSCAAFSSLRSFTKRACSFL